MHNIIRHLFAGTASTALGQQVAHYCGQRLGRLQVHQFADGELCPQLLEEIPGTHVCLVQSTYPPADHLMELLLTIDAAKQAKARCITVVIPYLGYMRQDHCYHMGGPVGAQLQAHLLAAAGADRLVTCELHAPHIADFFDFPVQQLSSTSVFIPYIQQLQLPRLTFAAPDAGGAARAEAYAQHFAAPLVLCNKHRVGKRTTVQVPGNVQGADVVLIDDIVDTGGTICLAAQQMKAQGARTVRAFCTHAVLSGDAYSQLRGVGLEELVVTDTVPLQQPGALIQVRSLAPLIAQALQQIS